MREQGEDYAEVWMENDTAVMERNYPFAYELAIFYQITKESLLIKAKIKNNSENILLHGLGWHPYFKASDLSAVRLIHNMKNQYDYIACRDLSAEEHLDLSKPLDHVFCNSVSNEYRLDNPRDGYSVICGMDPAYSSLVVYNGTPGCICVEPWCGIPNTANNKRFLKEILPGGSEEYSLNFVIEKTESPL